MKVSISKESLRELVKLKASLVTRRKTLDNIWSDINKYINPLLDNFSSESPPDDGVSRNNMREIFDNSVIKFSNRLADGIMAYSFDRGAPWFRLKEEEGSPEIDKEWLSYAEDHCYKQFSRSNFYDEGRTMVKMGADYGTGVMIRQEDSAKKMPVYKTIHIKNVYLDQNIFGEPDVLIYRFFLSASACVKEFGAENLPNIILEAYKQKSIKEFMIWHYIIPFNKYDLEIDGKDKSNNEYYSCYVPDCDNEKVLSEGTFRKKPFFAWRWSKSLDGSVWGTDSPGLVEISNIKQLNGMQKDFTRSVQLASRPPITATEGLEGRIDFTPEGITYIRAGEGFAVNRVVADLEGVAAGITTLKDGLSQSYMNEFFLLLTQNIERLKTATEVEGIRDEQSTMLSAFYGRMVFEFLEPCIEDMIDGEVMAGRLKLPPEAEGRQHVNVDMISPLAQLQKRKLLLSTTDQAMKEIVQFAQVKPEILDNFDFDEYVRTIADAYNIKTEVLLEEEEVKKIREQRAQIQMAMMQQQQEQQQAQAQADVYKKMKDAPAEGSPMTEGA
ncbi:MAG: portal protein [Spirochaetaceae bacterium]|nr:portal protein [Spirochaetaceae bacterium]